MNDTGDDRRDVEAMGVRLLTPGEVEGGWRVAEARIVAKIPERDRTIWIVACVVDGLRVSRGRVVSVNVGSHGPPRVSRFDAATVAPLAAALAGAERLFAKHKVTP